MGRYLRKAKYCLWILFFVLSARLYPGRVPQVCAAASWTYGSQLEGAEKDVYDALEDFSRRQGAKGLTKNGWKEGLQAEISRKYRMSESSVLASECYTGADAFLRDHSEIFWISGFNIVLRFRGSAEEEMTAACVNLYPIDYYDGIRGEIKKTQAAVDDLILAVKKCGTRYEKVRTAHDSILKLVNYATKGEDRSWHHTITGGLLKKYGHKGVCETYAKLFHIICRANDIPCILVTGGLKSANINHMWNYVQMENGKWYLVDITNDDQKKERHDYFLAGSGTKAFAGRVGSTHRASGYLHAGQETPFVLPALAKAAYGGTATKKLTVSEEKITVKKGEKYKIAVTRKPSYADDALTYSSSDTKIAAVNSAGKITAKKKGKTVITVRAASGKKARIQVTVI